MKWLKLLPAVLAIMIGVTGCMANHPSFKDEALLYMQEKYGEAFTWVERVDGQFGNAQKSGHVASPAFPGERILVTGIPGERESFSDNYIAYLRQEEATRQLQAIASSVDADWKAFCEPEEVGLFLSGDASALDYLQSGGILLKLFVSSEEWQETRDARMEAFRAALWSHQISANITVNVLEPGQLAEINEASYGEYLYGGGEGRFVMDQQGNFTVAKWR